MISRFQFIKKNEIKKNFKQYFKINKKLLDIGTIKFIINKKKYGFITPIIKEKDNREIYFNIKEIEKISNKIIIGQTLVNYEKIYGEKGPKAINIKIRKKKMVNFIILIKENLFGMKILNYLIF